MFPGVARTSLTLPKVLGGIQKTLNIANQVIPLYAQIKPIIKNAQSAFSVTKELIKTPANNTTKQITSTVQNKETQKKQEEPVVNLNTPVFFL